MCCTHKQTQTNCCCYRYKLKTVAILFATFQRNFRFEMKLTESHVHLYEVLICVQRWRRRVWTFTKVYCTKNALESPFFCIFLFCSFFYLFSLTPPPLSLSLTLSRPLSSPQLTFQNEFVTRDFDFPFLLFHSFTSQNKKYISCRYTCIWVAENKYFCTGLY